MNFFLAAAEATNGWDALIILGILVFFAFLAWLAFRDF